MRIRPATVDDVPALAALHVLGWQAAYRGLLPGDYLDALDPADRELLWRPLLEAGTTALLAEQDGVPTGFASYGPSRDVDGAGELYALYVAPVAWGDGTGRRLHDAALAALAEHHRLATLWVLAGNERAQAFYARQGWQPDGTAKTEERFDITLHELRFRRPLP